MTSSNLWDLDYGTDSSGAFGTIRRLAQQAVKVAQPQQPAYDPWQEEATSIYSDQPQAPMPQAEAWASADVGPQPLGTEYGPEMPVLNDPVPQGGGFWGGVQDFASTITPDWVENPKPTPNPFAYDPGNFWGSINDQSQNALDAVGGAYDQWKEATQDSPLTMPDTGIPNANIGGEEAGRFIGRQFPESWGEAAVVAPFGGVSPIDDILKGVGRGVVRDAATYGDNLARMGAEAVPTGAVGPIIAPAAKLMDEFGRPAPGPIYQISPTEGFDIARVAGGAETPEEIARRAEIERLSQEWMATMGTAKPNPADELLAGEAPIGGGPENWVRQAEPPPPVEPPLNLGGGEVPVPGGAANAGRQIAIDAQFPQRAGAYQPSLTELDPMGASGPGTPQFAPQTVGPGGSREGFTGDVVPKPVTPEIAEESANRFSRPFANGGIPQRIPQYDLLNLGDKADVGATPVLAFDTTKLDAAITRSLPEDTRGQVDDFINAARQQLIARPDNANLARRVTAPISGNLQSPFVDELVNQETNLRQLAWNSASKVESDLETAQKMVDETQDRFRKQMLDERYGPLPSDARKKAEATLKEGDRRRMLGGTTSKVWDAASDVLKQITLGGDVLASGGQQYLRAGRGSPSVVLGIINRMLEKGGIDTGIWQGDHLAQMLADGVPVGRSAAGLANKSIIERIPKIGPAAEWLTTVQFQGLDQVGALSYEGQMLLNRALHGVPGVGKFLGGDILDPQVRRNIARHSATVRSSAMAPTGARRSGIERRGLLSGPMTRAQINEALTFFQDPTRPENRLAALNLIGGTALIAMAGKKVHDEIGAEGSTYESDPFSPDFGSITTKFKNAEGQNIKISIMPQTSIPRGALLAADAALNGDPNGALEQIARTGVGRANVLPADALRLAPRAGYDESGFNISLPSKDAIKASIPVPLSLQDPIVRGDLSGNTLVASQSGLTNRGESNYEAFERQFERLTGFNPNDLLAGEVYDKTRQNPELQQFYDRWQGGRDSEAAKIMRDKLNGLTDAAPLLATEPREYREQVSNVVDKARIEYAKAKELGAVQDGPDPKGIRKAYDGFFEAIAPASEGGKVDYDQQEQLATEYLSSLDNGTRERILNELTFSPNSEYRGLLEARQKLKPYFGLLDDNFAEAKQGNPELAQYKSAGEFVDAEQKRLMDESGMERDMARKIAQTIGNAYMAGSEGKQIAYLLEHQELLPLLYKYDYYVPPAVKPIATAAR